MAQLNFNKLICQAKEIDKEIIYLKAKTMEPSKFGLGRTEAVEVLKCLDEELFQMKNKCSQELEITKEERKSMKSDIKNVKDYLKNLTAKLDKIETEAAKHGYQTFESHCSNQRNISNSPDISGITELSMADSQLFTPILPSKKLCGRDKRKLTPSNIIDHNFLSSTPNENISYQ